MNPGSKCRVCRQPAIIDLPRHNANFCAEHFLELCRRQVTKAIDHWHLLEPDDKVLVAVSGGKDSLAVWDLLLELGRLGLAALDGLRHQRLDARLGYRLAVDDGDVLRLRGQRRGEQRGERERSEAEGSGSLHGGEGHSGVARRAGVDGQGVDALGDQVAQGIIKVSRRRFPNGTNIHFFDRYGRL